MNEQPLIHVGGNVTGQVAYGEFVYQAQAPGGTVVQLAVQEPIRPRPRPIDVRPSPVASPVGRDQVISLLTSAASGRAAQIHAGEGWGKTTILKHLARHTTVEASRDGVAFLDGWGRPIEDIEQDLFEAFFETALPQMRLQATPGQIRGAMRDVDAVVLVDDLDLDRRQVERLLNDAPTCRMFITSTGMTLLDGTAVPLGGLDHQSAADLFALRLGRDLDAGERQAVVDYAASCAGQPLALVLATAAISRGAMDFAGLAAGAAAVAGALGDSLNLAERRALGVLQAVRGAPLPADAVGVAGSLDRPEEVLSGLRDDGLVQSASPRYRLPFDVGDSLSLTNMTAETLAGLTGWARSVADPDQIVEAASALVELANWSKHNQPEAAVALARSAHAGLFLGGAWAAWADLLNAAGAAATGGFDQAWTLHELGTRDMMTGDRAGASQRLHRALDLRRQIGDREGEAVTRHNLELLEGPPPPPQQDEPPSQPGPPDGGGGGGHWVAWLVALVAVVVLGGALFAVGILPLDGGGDITEDTPPATVAPGSLTAGVDPLDLGQIIIGEETEATLTVTNPGPGTVDLEDIVVSAPFFVDWDCGTLEALGTCGITVHFSPGDVGSFDSPLEVQHSGEGSPLSVRVTGSAIERPSAFVRATPGTVDFGTVPLGSADGAQIEISDDGDAPVESVSVFLENGGFFSSESDCSFLDPGASCGAGVSFQATEPGIFEDTLVVDHSGDNDTLRIPVRVQVLSPPDVVGEIVETGVADRAHDNGFFTYWPVPVTLRVGNVGGEAVESDFSIHFEDDSGSWLPSGGDPDDPRNVTITAGLGPGDSVDVPVFVAFATDQYDIGQVVVIKAFVDSCFGEELIEDPPCRVVEGDEGETNNRVGPVEFPIRVEQEPIG